jgi:hypothetical protein
LTDSTQGTAPPNFFPWINSRAAVMPRWTPLQLYMSTNSIEYTFSGGLKMKVVHLCIADIWYIDLPPNQPWPPLPPPLLNCSNLTSGISYPHPTEQASFNICRNATDYEVFTCPRTLLFDINSVLATQLNSSSPVSPASRSRGLTPILVIPRSLSSANNVGPCLLVSSIVSNPCNFTRTRKSAVLRK